MTTTVHPVDQVLPARQMASLGLQHMAISYLGSVAVPLMIASALKMSQADTIVLISTTLFCTGIATLLQTVGFWKFGVRLPVLQGAAFSSVGPVIAIGTNPQIGIAGICGAVIGAGIITMLIAPYVGRLRRFFPPVVIGCIVTVIGLQLLPVAYNWTGGGRGHADFGAPSFLLVAGVVLGTILVINRVGGPMMRNLAVLIGMIVGTLLAVALGMGDYSSVQESPWVTAPYPFYFGIPTFAILPIATILVVMIVQMVESMGLFVAIGDIVDKPIQEKEVVNGLRANGLASTIAGCFAAFPFIAHMENVGLVILSGVRSRWVVATSGVLMCLVALVPKAGAVIAATPSAALGGAGVAMFGVVVAAGVQTLAKVDYTSNRYNVMIVAFTIAIALVPVLAPTLFKQLPDWSQPFLHSGVVIACLVSVTLNILLNGVGKSDEAELKTVPHSL
ncbi:nucleobase:cation symporter-2 family protein [Crenobacter luteus]|uniref:Purine permease n=1 Tax=Crenobacter luteus TaxID=1452487 RepID=A0A161RC70_9NEIS|nr:nucleobase:cation symporter-2 family protein [Crenobacter luteus]KZE34818.1 purine permease [Crenobacter luteus]